MAKNYRSEVDAATQDLDFDAKTYRVVLDTSAGPIRLDLRPDLAPGHCRNIIGLAKIGYYDGVIFHRVIPGFMIQGGDPTGTGSGGPGYTIDAEFSKEPHVAGTLSMARTTDPNSAGGQFFICLPGDASFLNGQYTVFGATADDESLETVKSIGATPTDGSDRPKTEQTIKSAKVEESAK